MFPLLSLVVIVKAMVALSLIRTLANKPEVMLGWVHCNTIPSRRWRPTLPTFNSCTKCAGYPGIIHDRTPDCLGMDAWMTSQPNIGLIYNLFGLFICLAYLFEMLFMGVSATRHCQACGRLMQELSVCTVLIWLPYDRRIDASTIIRGVCGGTLNKYPPPPYG